MEKYSIERVVGQGSYGKALLCLRKADRKKCIIKQISIAKLSRKEQKQTEQEGSILAKLSHPNIVTFIESFTNHGNFHIVMEFADGGDLSNHLKQRKGKLLPEDKVLELFVQITLGLKHVHDRKILHRDLKGDNVFLMSNGIVKLGDFGVSRVLMNTGELAATQIGTPYYMSCEICEGKRYNSKSDIWSLGVILYELMCLKVPFDGNNMKQLIQNIIRSSPVPPSSAMYSRELRELLMAMLSKDSKQRPSTTTILSRSVVKQRISSFLSETSLKGEFSHTVLHGMNILRDDPTPKPVIPVIASSSPVPQPVKPNINAVLINRPAPVAPSPPPPKPSPAAAVVVPKYVPPPQPIIRPPPKVDVGRPNPIPAPVSRNVQVSNNNMLAQQMRAPVPVPVPKPSPRQSPSPSPSPINSSPKSNNSPRSPPRPRSHMKEPIPQQRPVVLNKNPAVVAPAPTPSPRISPHVAKVAPAPRPVPPSRPISSNSPPRESPFAQKKPPVPRVAPSPPPAPVAMKIIPANPTPSKSPSPAYPPHKKPSAEWMSKLESQLGNVKSQINQLRAPPTKDVHSPAPLPTPIPAPAPREVYSNPFAPVIGKVAPLAVATPVAAPVAVAVSAAVPVTVADSSKPPVRPKIGEDWFANLQSQLGAVNVQMEQLRLNKQQSSQSSSPSPPQQASSPAPTKAAPAAGKPLPVGSLASPQVRPKNNVRVSDEWLNNLESQLGKVKNQMEGLQKAGIRQPVTPGSDPSASPSPEAIQGEWFDRLELQLKDMMGQMEKMKVNIANGQSPKTPSQSPVAPMVSSPPTPPPSKPMSRISSAISTPKASVSVQSSKVAKAAPSPSSVASKPWLAKGSKFTPPTAVAVEIVTPKGMNNNKPPPVGLSAEDSVTSVSSSVSKKSAAASELKAKRDAERLAMKRMIAEKRRQSRAEEEEVIVLASPGCGYVGGDKASLATAADEEAIVEAILAERRQPVTMEESPLGEVESSDGGEDDLTDQSYFDCDGGDDSEATMDIMNATKFPRVYATPEGARVDPESTLYNQWQSSPTDLDPESAMEYSALLHQMQEILELPSHGHPNSCEAIEEGDEDEDSCFDEEDEARANPLSVIDEDDEEGDSEDGGNGVQVEELSDSWSSDEDDNQGDALTPIDKTTDRNNRKTMVFPGHQTIFQNFLSDANESEEGKEKDPSDSDLRLNDSLSYSMTAAAELDVTIPRLQVDSPPFKKNILNYPVANNDSVLDSPCSLTEDDPDRVIREEIAALQQLEIHEVYEYLLAKFGEDKFWAVLRLLQSIDNIGDSEDDEDIFLSQIEEILGVDRLPYLDLMYRILTEENL